MRMTQPSVASVARVKRRLVTLALALALTLTLTLTLNPNPHPNPSPHPNPNPNPHSNPNPNPNPNPNQAQLGIAPYARRLLASRTVATAHSFAGPRQFRAKQAPP